MSAPLRYRPDIDGLRAVAVVSVVAHHVFPHIVRGGFVGVDMFFVISGYLITRIVHGEATAGRFRYADFYWRRGRRLVPALLVVLFATWLVGAALLTGPEFLSLGKHIAAAGTFSSNVLLWREVGYFDSEAGAKPLLHLWSLGVEEQFYLLWPALLLITTRAFRRPVLPLLLLGAASLGVSAWTAVSASSFGFFMLPARLWELLAGGVLALWHSSRGAAGTGREIAEGASPILREALSWAGALLLLASFRTISEVQPYPGTLALLPVGATVALIAAGPQARLNRWVLGHRWVVGLGLISYPLYLWHWPLLSILQIVGADAGLTGRSLDGVKVLVALGSVGLAWLTYRHVERPMQRALARRVAGGASRVRQTAWSFATLLLAASLGVATVQGHGFPVRYAGPRAANEAGVLAVASRRYAMSRHRSVTRCVGDAGPTGPEQCLRSLEDPVRVVLLGDSHAEAAFPGLVSALPDVSIQLLSHTRCPPLVGTTRRTDFTEPACVAAMEAAVRAVAASASVTTVVLVSRGPLYTTGGDDDRRLRYAANAGGAALVPATDSARLALFRDGLRRTATVLTNAGKQVILAHDVPELSFRPRDCIVGRPFGIRAPIRPCSVDRVAVEGRNADYRRVLAALADSVPGTTLFDAIPVFCDQRACPVLEDGGLRYADDNHVSLIGSERLGSALGATVLATLRGPGDVVAAAGPSVTR